MLKESYFGRCALHIKQCKRHLCRTRGANLQLMVSNWPITAGSRPAFKQILQISTLSCELLSRKCSFRGVVGPSSGLSLRPTPLISPKSAHRGIMESRTKAILVEASFIISNAMILPLLNLRNVFSCTKSSHSLVRQPTVMPTDSQLLSHRATAVFDSYGAHSIEVFVHFTSLYQLAP